MQQARVLVFDRFELDLDRRVLRRDGREVSLTARPLEMLLYLASHRDRVVPGDELMERVWPGLIVSESALSSQLKLVRQALGDDGRTQRFLRTERGRGYRFIAAVEERRAEARTADQAPTGSVEGALPFIGRREVVARLEQALEAALAGEGRIVLLSGEAGIGKTRTTEEIASASRERDIPVVPAWCHEGEGAPPYWPWVQILRRVLERESPDALRSHLGSGAADLAELVPELREAGNDAPRSRNGTSEETRFRLFDTISRALEWAAQDSGLLAIVDDLHWADTSSLRLLDYLVHEVGRTRLLLVGTYREPDVGRNPALLDVAGRLLRHDRCERVALEGLEADEITELVQSLTDGPVDAELAPSLLERTNGNPFFVKELIRYIDGHGALDAAPDSPPVPENVRAVIVQRLQRLSSPSQGQLQAASAIGRNFELEVLRAVVGRDADSVSEAIEEAIQAGFLAECGSPGLEYRFVHALVQEAVHAGLRLEERAQLHRRIGETIEDLCKGNPDPHLDRLAHHFAEGVAAGAREKALDYCAVHSFRPAIVERIRKLERRMPCSLLTTGHDVKDWDQLLAFALSLNAQGVSVHHSAVSAKRVRRAHLRELRFSTWTVDKRDDVRRVAACGVDAITTNYPDRARRWLPKR